MFSAVVGVIWPDIVSESQGPEHHCEEDPSQGQDPEQQPIHYELHHSLGPVILFYWTVYTCHGLPLNTSPFILHCVIMSINTDYWN